METEYSAKTEASETPSYNQILELEIINLHQLHEEIKRLSGVVLDVNTDGAVCTFPYNKLPFEINENDVVQGYYYDLEETAPKYRMAEEPKRNEIGRMAKYTRDGFDTLKKPKWKIHQDVEDNDMAPLVKTILESNKSWNINGRAGTGKSHLVRMLQEEMDKK